MLFPSASELTPDPGPIEQKGWEELLSGSLPPTCSLSVSHTHSLALDPLWLKAQGQKKVPTSQLV